MAFLLAVLLAASLLLSGCEKKQPSPSTDEPVSSGSEITTPAAILTQDDLITQHRAWRDSEQALTVFAPKGSSRWVYCEGFGKAYKLLCARLNHPCYEISGWSGEYPLAWNYVQMEDDKWYAVDVTMDLPVFLWNPPKHTYFLVGRNSPGERRGTVFTDEHAPAEAFDTYLLENSDHPGKAMYPPEYPTLSGKGYLDTE